MDRYILRLPNRPLTSSLQTAVQSVAGLTPERPLKRQKTSNEQDTDQDNVPGLGSFRENLVQSSSLRAIQTRWLDDDDIGSLSFENCATFSDVCDTQFDIPESYGDDSGVFEPYRSSIYVDAFNLALNTVLEHESYLFSERELFTFQMWKDLDYDAQYLYVRLFLRKKCAWHRVEQLRYKSNILDINAAIASLSCQRKYPLVLQGSGEEFGGGFQFSEKSEDLITTTSTAVTLLSLEELKTVAKDFKVKGKVKADLQAALIEFGERQTTLLFPESNSEPSHRQAGNRGEMICQVSTTLFLKIVGMIGPCIRVCETIYRLFERVHLVFYRTNEWTEKSLTVTILAKMSKKNFPEYMVCRTRGIFETRDQLLEYEEALRMAHEVDELMDSGNSADEDSFSKVVTIFIQISDKWRQALQKGPTDVQGSQYQQHLSDDSYYNSYMSQFCAAHVFTRLAHKAACALGRLHEYSQEYNLLTELLGQRLFRLSRRGEWYQRKALLEERYMMKAGAGRNGHTDTMKQSQHQSEKLWLQRAARTCEQALQDPDCHIVYHYGLQKRLSKLEQRLRIPRRHQHDFGYSRFLSPEIHTIKGIQVWPGQERLVLTKGKMTTGQNSRVGARTLWIDESALAVGADEQEKMTTVPGAECTVETMCLYQYQKRGWKGFHSEGGIMRTLFACLFYDIMFLCVPNVFQTAYQTHPLDLFTDAFYATRASEINHRLVQIANDEAEEIIRGFYAEQGERHPCVMGLDWSFDLQDLVELARCFHGNALATICKILAQEYRQRIGGIPDLLLWRLEPQPEALFVEVKSSNDRLSDTQRLWIHLLLEAGIRVALCNAVAKNTQSGQERGEEEATNAS